MPSSGKISIPETIWGWWVHAAQCEGWMRATRRLAGILGEYVRDSTPERRKQRYGDADYDWDFRVNTTSGAVGWRDRLIGMFHSAYQPTEPSAFHEMLDTLQRTCHVDFRDLTFLDLGSGKGRTLLMASEYPFRSILGVELLPSLHEIAQENIRKYGSAAQKCFSIQSICADATRFPVPDGPLLLYLFNPLPEVGLRQVVERLEESLKAKPRPVFVVYHNPLEERVLAQSSLVKILGTIQYSVWTNARK